MVPLIRIGSGFGKREDALVYQERYIKAMQSIPDEFWPAVRIVCIEDKELKADKNIIPRSLLSKQIVYHLKSLLVLGLERLVKFYFQKNKKSSLKTELFCNPNKNRFRFKDGLLHELKRLRQ